MTTADAVAKEEVSEVEAKTTVARPLHPLKHEWTYWYLNDDRQCSWEARLKEVCTFGTVEHFWALYNNIRPPSALNNTCDYNVFKKGIQPMWEVEENSHGGRWLINIEKGKSQEMMDIIWLEILIALIGEQFGDDMDQICGLVANVRTKGSRICLWTRDGHNDESNMRIGMVLRNKLLSAELPAHINKPLFDVLKYEDHVSCQKKSSSTLKAKLTISSQDPPQRGDVPEGAAPAAAPAATPAPVPAN